VTVTLVPVNASTLPAGCADAASKVTCTIRSSTSTAGDCQLALPCAAEFRVRGCVASGSGQSCSSQLLAGRNASSWQQSPWAAPVPPNVLADKAEYSEGSEVVLQVQNSYYGTVSALVMWGNALQRKTKLFRQLSWGGSAGVIASGAGCLQARFVQHEVITESALGTGCECFSNRKECQCVSSGSCSLALYAPTGANHDLVCW